MNSFKSRAKKNAVYAAKQPPVAAAATVQPGQPLLSTRSTPTLSSFLHKRDYTGALTLLQHQKADTLKQRTSAGEEQRLAWLAYCHYHLGDHQKALDVYTELAERAKQPLKEREEEKSEEGDEEGGGKVAEATTEATGPRAPPEQWQLYVACCHFYLGNYQQADTLLESLPASPLSSRLQLHISHRLADETRLMKLHGKMSSAMEDQLSLASIHYLRNHYQEATDIYKKLLLDQRDATALQVYVAMCYYKLDYYDVSLEILQPYIAQHPDSATAMNLKACNHYKLYDGKAAETELKPIIDTLTATSAASASAGGTGGAGGGGAHSLENDILRHNLVVFRNGEQALSTLTPLVDLIPEARLNLAIHHLRQHQVAEADALMKELEPVTPQEYILKGVVSSAVGQLTDSRPHLKAAQEYFQLVGASASECDTIPGRQCMASCFFLLKQFDDVLIYLNSIKAYSGSDSIFLFNHGIALSAVEQFSEALEALVGVSDANVKSTYVYLSWLCRCYVMTGAAKSAWEIYLKMDSTNDSFQLLQLIANDCYKIGSFFYAAKAFDVLERLDPTEAYWEGKRGACVGVFQQVLAKKERKELMRDVVAMLKGSSGVQSETSVQVDQLVRVMRKWCMENGVPV